MSGAVYNIPAGISFADALAAELLRRHEGAPEALPQTRILLPTRRACRIVREAFLRCSDGRPLLLPRLQPLGDVDEEELVLEVAAGDSALSEALLNLPPAIDPLQRRLLLARSIMAAPDFASRPGQALALAETLGRLMDRIYTEELDMAALSALVDDDFAAHWQVTLDFLKTLSEVWPQTLQALGKIDVADRRSRLLTALAQHWAQNPPLHPIIAAGTTGSIPATARLLKVIAALPQGAIILPGLDQDMDEESWQALDETHPQATLKNLLRALEMGRGDVRPWPGLRDKDTEQTRARRRFASEMMRPAATTERWIDCVSVGEDGDPEKTAMEGIVRCDAATEQEEALAIAIMLRRALETPGKTAALVTPDRALARRVAALCGRWDIEVDDSAGTPFAATPVGVFLRGVIAAATGDFSPVYLLSLLRHRFCSLSWTHEDFERAVSMLELSALRGPRPPPGLEGLRNRMQEKSAPDIAHKLIDDLQRSFEPLLELVAAREAHPFSSWLGAHIKVSEALAATAQQAGAEILWAGEEGEAASVFLSALRDQADILPPVDGESYRAMIEELIKLVTVRPRFGAHPRLAILGQLEARLLQADLVVLGGLNEGIWPPDPGHDPWMSRPMMRRFGLPVPERAIGLAAHDFVQCFCAPSVVLTRAGRRDGAPTVPARWLQRLDTVLVAAGINPDSLMAGGREILALARLLDRSEQVSSCARPAPAPDIAHRPRRLSVTRVETWLRDPYSIYARYVLGLKKLKPLEKEPDAADRGDVLHEILHEFAKACHAGLPDDARRIFLDVAQNVLARRADDSGFWNLWYPRLERIADWFVENEAQWRAQGYLPFGLEAGGAITLPGPQGPFVLTARADRIDRHVGGGYAIIDYKSGGDYKSAGKIKSGEQPQLPLEALIAQEGGFKDIPAGPVESLSYWLMTGGVEEGSIVALSDNVADIIDRARQGLEALIAHYDDVAIPYYSLPDPERAPRYNDYEHLARVREWAALDESEEEAA